MSQDGAVSEQQVIEVLKGVLDPELDESLVELGFVAGVRVQGAEVQIDLRLPTFWCAPNFSWLMAEDTRQAVSSLPGVKQVNVTLLDHYASDEISAGVSAHHSFEQSFEGEATGDLAALRRLFRRKSFYRRQDRLFSTLPRNRLVPGLRIADLPDSPETCAYLAIRSELNLDCAPDTLALTDVQGRLVEDVTAHLRRIGLMRVSMDANTVMCRGLLDARYGLATAEPVAPRTARTPV
jgi:metal-sulfur cluster biosynthetic enzyme